MNDTTIHVIGNVADIPRLNRTSTGTVTNFRLASTPRRWDDSTKGFVDGATLWLDVACWGELSGNVSRSISKGDPVVVVGNLTTETWETEAGRRSATRLKATAVGLNLSRGWSEFKRTPRAEQPPAVPAPQEPAEDAFETGDPYAGRSTDYLDGAAALHEVSSDAGEDREVVLT